MQNRLSGHLRHHGRFYVAAAVGGLVYVSCWGLAPPLPIAAAGAAFFLSYILMMSVLALTLSRADLRARAEIENEGGGVVGSMALIVVAYCCVEIFTVINQKHTQELVTVAVLLGAPLGWLMFHMMAAFHYAYLFYRRGENGEPQEPAPLSFPKTAEPGIWEFLYYAFVIAMTAQ